MITEEIFNKESSVINPSNLNPEEKIEQTSIYQTINHDASKKIVVAMRDNGEVNTLFPVVEKLIEDKNYRISIFADGPGKELLQKQSKFEELKLKKNILVEVPKIVDEADLILVSQSMDSGIDTSLLATAATGNKNKATVLAIEDFPGGCNSCDNVLSSHNSLLTPDLQCVMNIQSKKALMNTRPEFDPEKIVITGIPSFDNINIDHKENVRREFRNKYGIGENKKIIVWVGGYDMADRDSFKLFVDGVKGADLDDYFLIIRRHPRDKENNNFYNNATLGLERHLIDTASESMDVVRQAADLVVSVYSTEAVKAVCEQTPTLLIMIPSILGQIGMENFSFLIGEDGSASVVREKNEMVDTLKKSLLDESYMKKNKDRMEKWKVDGRATEKIIKLITEILHK